MRIIAFPPVAVQAHAHGKQYNLRRSTSFFGTADDAISTLAPPRRLISLDVSALGRDRAGAGYLAQLLEECEGGMHPVRLTLGPTNWWQDRAALQKMANADLRTWTANGQAASWTSGGNPASWAQGPLRSAVAGTSGDGRPQITVSGLPPGALVARPDDVVRVYPLPYDGEFQQSRVVRMARAGADGVAVIVLRNALPAGFVTLAAGEVVVARIDPFQQAMQPLNANWTQAITLSEVLPAFIPEDAEDVNPWV